MKFSKVSFKRERKIGSNIHWFKCVEDEESEQGINPEEEVVSIETFEEGNERHTERGTRIFEMWKFFSTTKTKVMGKLGFEEGRGKKGSKSVKICWDSKERGDWRRDEETEPEEVRDEGGDGDTDLDFLKGLDES